MENNLSKILGERLLKVSDVNAGTGLSKTTLTNIYYQRTSILNKTNNRTMCYT